MVKILDAKYEKADLPAIIRENCSHLTASDREKLLSMLQIEVALQRRSGWLETTFCILWTKGRYEAIPWQALPYPAQT